MEIHLKIDAKLNSIQLSNVEFKLFAGVVLYQCFENRYDIINVEALIQTNTITAELTDRDILNCYLLTKLSDNPNYKLGTFIGTNEFDYVNAREFDFSLVKGKWAKTKEI